MYATYAKTTPGTENPISLSRNDNSASGKFAGLNETRNATTRQYLPGSRRTPAKTEGRTMRGRGRSLARNTNKTLMTAGITARYSTEPIW